LPDDFLQTVFLSAKAHDIITSGNAHIRKHKKTLQKDQEESNAEEVQLCPDYIP
jgi:hypothetical protein